MIINYFEFRIKTDAHYSYNDAEMHVREKIKYKQKLKIQSFNKDITYLYDSNGMPKIIHFTLKDKNTLLDPQLS
jgi:hypothetical protein